MPLFPTIVLIAAAVVPVVAFIFSPRCWQSLYSRLIFGPVAADGYEPIELHGIAGEDVFFESRDGTKLHGWYFRQSNAPLTLLVSHSNWGNVAEWRNLIDTLLSTGASVFIYDYRGYGRSEGTPTVSGICKDGLAAYEWLVNTKQIPAQQIVHFGSSLGGGVACDVASRNPCGGIILHGAFSSLRAMATQMLPATRFIPDLFFFRPKMDNAAKLKELTNLPLLVLHGKWDHMIDSDHAERNFLASGSNNKRHVPLNAGHMDTGDEATYVQAIKDLLAIVVANAAPPAKAPN